MEDFSAIVDGLNRLAKLDLDLGTAEDLDDAMARLQGYSAHIVAGPEVASSVPHQIALLTLVNIAARFALGGLSVSGDLDCPLLAPWKGDSLAEAVQSLGGEVGRNSADRPTAVIGTSDFNDEASTFQVTFEGWRGGIVPIGSARLDEGTTIAPAAVLAAGLAAAEIFAMLRGEPVAGRRQQGLSLWKPDGDFDWLSAKSDGPTLAYLPDRLWVLGLGHLGQAFLWTLAMSPYHDRSAVNLVLQDTDVVTTSTVSTSILTRPAARGLKTRDVAITLEDLGFSTIIVERPFDDLFQRRSDDPSILICGVDNALARRQLEAPGFPLIVEAGLGRTAADFQSIRLHTFPSGREAKDLWSTTVQPKVAVAGDAPGYHRLREKGVDDCGLARLAGTAVGAPFVGTIAAALMFSQTLRLLHGGLLDAVVDIDLRALAARRAVENCKEIGINPGFQDCCV